MIWLILIGLFLMGGTPTQFEEAAQMQVKKGGDGKTFGWVLVTNPAGMTAFGMVREGDAGSGMVQSIFRAECYQTEGPAVKRIEDLLAMSLREYLEAKEPPWSLGPAINCGPEMAARLLAEYK